MDNRTMELLETLEEKIENIKWMITAPLSFKKAAISDTINLIRRSSGILSKAPKGIVFENKIRKEWKANVLKRINS